MNEESQNHGRDTERPRWSDNGQPPEIRYTYVNDLYAGLVDGGSIRVEEMNGSLVELAKAVDHRCYQIDDGEVVVFEVVEDIDGTPTYTLTFHCDDNQRLARLQQIRRAVDAAEKLLLGAGYVDDAHLAVIAS